MDRINQFGLTRRALLGAAAAFGAAASLPALADLRIEITGVGATQLPIAVRPFQGTSGAPADIAKIITDDLLRSGAFRLIDVGGEDPTENLAQPEGLPAAAQAGAAIYVVGQVREVGPSRWETIVFVYDTVTGQAVASSSFAATKDMIRMAGHRAADLVYTKLTGEGPIFASQLAYVAQLGERRYELIVSDCDGETPMTALASPEPIISPVWSPDGRQLAYVSFENHKPIVYLHELSSGVRRPIAAFRGNNSAPAFSPDGRTLAVALSRDGLTQIYFLDIATGALRRFSRSYGIDTEPFFTQDGQWVYFTSDRGGTPQIYRQRVSGGAAERVTFGSNYAISPAVSPQGDRLAYVSRLENKFRLAVMDLATGQDLLVTTTEKDESPSFAPNGRFLVYATEVSGRGVLGTCSADARLSTRLTGEGDIREPAWGPILN